MRGIGIPLICWVLAAASLLSSCKGKALTPSPADDLRRQVVELQRQQEEQQGQIRELTAKLAQKSAAAGIDPVVEAARPLLGSISLTTGTGLEAQPDGTPGCLLRVVVVTQDGRGRFLQVVGELTVSLIRLVEGCEPEVTVCRTFGPLEVREAWRSSFMGTHYTFEVPLESSAACRGGFLRVVFRDALSGESFSAEESVEEMDPEASP